MFTGTPIGNLRLKRTGFVAMVVFYLYAGINHLVMPGFYWPLIPPIFQYAEFINITSGVLEIVLAILLIFKPSRRLSAIAIVLMLMAYLPSHIYFIQIGSCIENGLCVPPWLAWVRLIIIQPLLMYWAWSYRNYLR